MNKLKYLFAKYICHYLILNNSIILYRWAWLILPNWRYYIRLKYDKNHKVFGRYTDHYWKPDRVELFKINNYSRHFKLW